MIIHNGTTILGTHEVVLTQAPELVVKRTHFFGLTGTSEIYGGSGGRIIYTRIWIHGQFSTVIALVAYLRGLDALVGNFGDLTVLPNPQTGTGVPRIFGACTFEGFFPEEPGPLPDATGMLDGLLGSWFCPGRLQFYQLDVSNG